MNKEQTAFQAGAYWIAQHLGTPCSVSDVLAWSQTIDAEAARRYAPGKCVHCGQPNGPICVDCQHQVPLFP